jgi:hypothetical protein
MAMEFDADQDWLRFDTALWSMIEEGVPEDIVVGKIWDRLGHDRDQLDALMEHLRIFHHNMLDDARIPAWEDEPMEICDAERTDYRAQRARSARLAPLVGRVIAALVHRMG